MATVSLSACHHLKLCFQLTPSLMSFKLLQNTNKQTAPVVFNCLCGSPPEPKHVLLQNTLQARVPAAQQGPHSIPMLCHKHSSRFSNIKAAVKVYCPQQVKYVMDSWSDYQKCKNIKSFICFLFNNMQKRKHSRLHCFPLITKTPIHAFKQL